MNITVLLTHSPLDGIKARESLDLIFALSAVDHQVSVVFTQDAVYQLLPATDSQQVSVKDIRRSFKLFELYDIEQLYVSTEALEQRQLTFNELVPGLQPLDKVALSQLLNTQQHVIKA